MKYLMLLFLCSCAYKPTNTDLCVKDAPKHEHCAMTIEGNDFDIDDSGSHQYTQYGQNLNADQYDAVALRISPWSWAAIKKDWLNYCHANPKDCVYSDAVKMIQDFESRLGLSNR